ncbi:hypothetical protein ACFV0B_11585 [Streptomyces xanthophaeus]|uniref:hypothetical protein n=1 Tax=Streptomyces xanthophaeus TaxID=67385 RepID=UPI003695DBC2
MPPVLIPILLLELLYAVACVTIGVRPGAPLWLRWPALTWERVVHGPTPRPRPDYARIERLERELGFTDPFERPIAPEKVCLFKGCDGPTDEPRHWNGALLARFHWH